MAQRLNYLGKCEGLCSDAQRQSGCQEQQFTPLLKVLAVGTR